MKLPSENKRIPALIVLFPPIILLVYAIVSYLILFESEIENSNSLVSFYRYEVKKTIKKDLESRAKTVNKFINIDSNKNVLIHFQKLLDSIYLQNKSIFILNDKGKILYKHGKIPIDIVNKIKGITGHYEDDNFLAYAIDSNKLHYYILLIADKHISLESVNRAQESLTEQSKNNIKNSLFWLGLIWFLLLFVSLYISILVFNKLREYEKKIQKNKEEIIFQSRQAMLGELLPMIAHQWRQPLNKIAAVLMRMRFNISSGNPNAQVLDKNCQLIEDSVDLMSNTLEDFRTFYRPKEKEQNVEISEIIRKAEYFLDELLKKRKIRVSHNLTKVEAKVHANELLQVLINLIKNAVDAMGDKGHLDISLKDLDEKYIEIRIEDDGTGIPEDMLEKIFEPHESTKQASMGLGLYMSKLIIEGRFKGKIKAYNTDHGAGFLIVIPKNGGGESRK